jgi:phosphate-selective porin OprO/OprP
VPRPVLLAFLLLALPIAAQSPPIGFEVGGKVHADVRAFPSGPSGEAAGFLMRRARVEVSAEVTRGVRAAVEGGLGEGEVELVDGYVEADLWGGAGPAGLVLRVGRFKTPAGYESLQSSSDLRFAERAFPTAISPRRDLGAMLEWESDGLEAQAGVFNGVPDGASRSDDWGSGPDGAARLFIRPGGPLAGLGVGAAVAVGSERGTGTETGLDDYETPGDVSVFAYAPGVRADGLRLRAVPQATLDLGRVSMLGEWALARHRIASDQGSASVTHHAWQVAASVVLLGQPRREERPVPWRSVPDGGPGAVEVSARLHGLAFDRRVSAFVEEQSVQRATAAGIAVNWFPTSTTRLGLTVERTAFGAFELDVPDANGTRPAETFAVLRAQIDF